MAEVIKVLGQSKPSAATLTDLYAVPAATTAVVSTITVCNQSATPTTFRVSVAPAAAADAVAQYFCYDVPIAANEAKSFTLGLTLAATDKVRVYATLATVSFHAYGVETS